MPKLTPSIERRFSRLTSCFMAMAMLLLSGISGAACIPYADPQLHEYSKLVRTNPPVAEQRIQVALRASASADTRFRASLIVLLVEAYSIQEKHNDMRTAADEAFALLKDPTHPAFLNLLYIDATRPLEQDAVPPALQRAEAALAAQAKGSPGEACALIALGILEHVADRVDRASIHLTHAYRMSSGPARLLQRISAAVELSIIMEALRDLPAALSLIREVSEHFKQEGAIYELAAAYFLEGFILMEMDDHVAARDVLLRSRAISEELNDPVGSAYTDVNLCLNDIGAGNTRAAREHCENARRAFRVADLNEPRKQALTGLAQIELLESNARGALGYLDEVLEEDGRDLPPFRLAQIYELRGQARRDLGLYREAMDDYENFMRRFKANKEDERAKEASALRARFEIDREIERNEFLRRELTSKGERLAAQSARLRWMIAAAVSCAGVVLLLTYLLMMNQKKKQLLVRLAQEDELTGLPNRRHTLMRATDIFEHLRRDGSPFTICILDLDHFKRINDRFGHAAGDYVLKEFARLGRNSIRETDLLGRWGGEEFLILLPDTPLDVALEVVERVRNAASQIVGGPLPADYQVTLSAGLATNESPGPNLETIIGHADVALYNAKNRGRNQALVAQESYDASPVTVRRTLKQAGIDLATGKFAAAS